MRGLCSDAVTSYKAAQRTLQNAMATYDKFALASSNGNVPSPVLMHLKLPPHQTLQGIPDVMVNPRVVEVMTLTMNNITSTQKSTTNLLTTVYTVQVEKARELVDVAKCADVLGSTLNEYCDRIMTRAGKLDLAAWQPCVSALKAAFTDELRASHLELTARLDKEAAATEAKATATLVTRADAEMADANLPIKEMIRK
ncbi:hypothetical protein B0H19DRAFT_964579, partial [Mycena capillaripes]